MKNKRIFLLPAVLLAIFMLVSFSNDGNESHYSNPAMDFAAGIKIGWNLGNSLDAHNNGNPNETAWSNPRVNQAIINAVREQGFDAVRIPVTWGSKIGRAPDYTIDAAWLNRVAEVVGYVNSTGMKAIVNIHHDGADSHNWLSVRRSALTEEGKAEVNAKFIAVWRQIAEKFRDAGSFLIFEGFNELHDGGWGYTGFNVPTEGRTRSYSVTNADLNNQRARVNELNQLFVNTVRSVGGENANRFLLINGLVTRPSETFARHFVLPNDTIPDRLIVSVHYYDPYDFTGSASQTTWGDKALRGNWANENHVRNTFNQIKTRFINNGIPVFIGEYGAVRQSSAAGKAHRLYYLEYVTKYAADCGLVPFFWDNGSSRAGSEGFGLFNRSSGALLSDAADVISVIMRAAKQDYPLSSITPP
jgi:endoglucanase